MDEHTFAPDIVADRFTRGVRWGDQVAKDRIAVRVGDDERLRVFGAPSHFAKHRTPRKPQELPDHHCIALRLPTCGGLYACELRTGKRELRVRVDGPFVFSGTYPMLNAARSGVGVGLPAETAGRRAHRGRLACVLEAWSPTCARMRIFYANRRQQSRALAVVVEALRHRS